MHSSYYVVTAVFYVSLFLCLRPIHKNKRLLNNSISLLWAAAAPLIIETPINLYNHMRSIGDIAIASWVLFVVLILTCIPGFYFAVLNQADCSTDLGVSRIIETSVLNFTRSRKDILSILLVFFGELPGFAYSILFLRPMPVIFLSVLTSAIMIPIAEEMSFRLVLPMIFESTGRWWIDVSIFSILFAFMHFYDNGNLLEFLSAFVFSIYCYFLMKRTNKLVYPILFHVIYNIRVIAFA